MKKLFILIAFLMITGTVVSEAQIKKMPTATTAPFSKPQMSVTNGSVLENLFLNQKGDRFLADDKETYVAGAGIAHGQIAEMGPNASTYIAYDPISKYIFAITTARYSVANAPDSIRKAGELVYGKYEPRRTLALTRQLYYDTTDIYPLANYNPTTYDGIAPDKNIDEWSTPTIVVANPENSTDISKLKIAFSTKMERFSRGVVANALVDPKPRYNTISIMNGDKLASPSDDPTFNEGVSFLNLDQPDPNATSTDIGGYFFNRPLKGVVAYIDNIPYSFFFGPLFNDAAVATNPLLYGIVAVSLNNIPAVGRRNNLGDNLQTMQVLSPEVTSIFSANSMLAPGASFDMAHGFNIDSDDKGNIYIALMEATKKAAEDQMNTTEYQNLKMPAVVKLRYNTSTTTDQDIAKDGYTIESMPFDVLRKYIIEEKGGVFDPTNRNTAPIFNYHSNTGGIGTFGPDVPFLVTAEDSAHFLLPLYFVYETTGTGEEVQTTYGVELVEVINSGSNWTIRPVAPLEEWLSASMPGWSATMGYFYYSRTNGLTYWNGGDSYSGVNTGIDPQIAITADKNYLVAKWQSADTAGAIKMSATLDYVSATTPVTTDTMYVPSLYLSYRHVHPDSTWHTPVRASHMNYPEKAEDFDPLRDTISFMGTVMPRIVPSVDEVIVSYSYALDQNNDAQKLMADKITKFRSHAYRYSGIIVPSARTGRNPVGIKEGEPATTDHLSPVYPNPADNTVNFSFSLLKPAYTRLTISNSLGQEVAVVVDQFCNASQYNWNDYNVANLPAGIYYFTLTSGDVRQTKIFTIAR